MDLEILKQARDRAFQIAESDIQAYVLRNPEKLQPDFLRMVADQWIARQKARGKLPGWFADPRIIYPAPLSVEQSSSSLTAEYKASVFFNPDMPELVDLTGGMGVDTSAFARYHKQVTYVERNETLAQITQHNFDVLGLTNIKVVNADAIHYLGQLKTEPDTHFYIDPARRDASRNKVFRIEGCEPDILGMRKLMGNYMVKYSPVLDIKLALEQLQTIAEVHVVAVENEVKELLFLNGKGQNPAKIVCVNFRADATRQTFVFNYGQEQSIAVEFAMPQQYIYEPNAAILKAGAFRSIGHTFGLEKLAPNSHLYTSGVLLEDFPGRSFICDAVCKFDKKEILSKLPGHQANVSTRNFPLKPDEIKKKLGLKDGGDSYLFATENHRQQKIVLICRKPH